MDIVNTSNLPLLFAGGAVILAVIIFFAMRRTRSMQQERARRAAPLGVFLKELSKPDFEDRRLASLFDPKIFAEVEIGTIKAMARCVGKELGEFEKLDENSARVTVKKDKEGVLRFKAVADCSFTKRPKVNCEMAWFIAPTTNKAHVLSFRVRPAGDELDVIKHINPKDFEKFGERFVTALMSKTPDVALKLMAPSLANKFEGDASKITTEMKRVIVAMGGFKDKQFEMDLSDARMTTIGPDAQQRAAVLLEFIIQGTLRDIKVTIVLIFTGLKTLVLRYSFAGMAMKERTVFVDESGTQVA